MATQPGTLELLTQQIGLALQPLEQKLQSGYVISFFDELGLHFPTQLLTASFTGALNTTSTAAGALPNLITQLATAIQGGNEGAILSAGVQLVQKIGDVIAGVKQISQALSTIGPLPGMDPAEVSAFATDFLSHLLGYLLISYVEQIAPEVIGVGNLVGILDYLPTPAGDAAHPAYTLRQLQLGNLEKLLKSPADLLETRYDWGVAGFDGSKLMPRLAASLQLLGFAAKLNGTQEVDTSLVTLLVNGATNPPGLNATFSYPIDTGITITLPITTLWSIQIQVQGAFAAGLTASLTPPANVTLTPPSGTLNGNFQSDLVAHGTNPTILLGQTGGSRLQFDSFALGAGVNIHWDSTNAIAEPTFTGQITGGRAVIDTSNADGFIATVLGGIHVEAGFDLSATWQPDTGFHVQGGAQLEITLPLHLTLGPISIPTLYLIAGASPSGVPLEISVALGLALGPIQVSVDRIGIEALLSFPDQGGNLGPANLSIDFKPPNGLGLEIDAGVASGGGYIFLDPAKGQYAGVLDITTKNWFR